MVRNNKRLLFIKNVNKKINSLEQEIADLYQVKAFENYEDMLNEVDAVDVAATTTWHYDLAKPALLKGCHVFLEKPITSEIAQAEEFLKSNKYSIKEVALMSGYTNQGSFSYAFSSRYKCLPKDISKKSNL